MLDSESLFHIGHFLIPLYSDGFSISMGLPIVYFKESEVAILNYDVQKSVLCGHSKRTPKLVFKTDYRLMQVKSILSTFIKLPFVIKICVLSIFEWPLKAGFTVFLPLKGVLVLANSADPDEMQHYAAFHLSLHGLLKDSFMCILYTKGYSMNKINLAYH